MSFKAYVMMRRRGPNPQGDFIEHAQRAADLPDAATWEELRAYLLVRDACPGAIDSARSVWKCYRAQRRRTRRRALLSRRPLLHVQRPGDERQH